jgi:hypothetical protein
LAFLDAQFDPTINQFAERLVCGQTSGDLNDAVGPNEAADRLTAMDIGYFVVGAVPTGLLRVHATATGAATDLILLGHASGMHGTQGQ